MSVREQATASFSSLRPASGIVLLVGAVLNAGFVAHGVSAIWNQSLSVGAAAAALTVGFQLLIGRTYKNYGLRLGSALAVLYAVLVVGNIVLTAAGVSASLLANQLGRGSIVRELSDVRAEVTQVADRLDGVAAAAGRLAETSALSQKREAAVGGTCAAPGAAPSPKGVGPIARMREADRELFATLSTNAAQLAATMRTAERGVQQTLATYDARRHATAIATIAEAMDTARAGTAQAHRIKAQVTQRLAQWQAGAPVLCSDSPLVARMQALAETDYPQVAAPVELPAAPTPGSAARALIGDLIGRVQGQPFDLALWWGPLLGGVLPDILLLLGLSMVAYDRRVRSPIVDDVARQTLGRTGNWADIAAAARAATDDTLASLTRFHSRKSGWLGDSDVLTIPDTAEGRQFLVIAQGLTRKGVARYHGLYALSALRPVPAPSTPIGIDQPCHFFFLKKGVWTRILLEGVRSAASRMEKAA